MTTRKVLVTGASGFIGEALVLKLLSDKKFEPVAAMRRPTRILDLCDTLTFDLNAPQCLPAMDNVDVVIHTAARVHVMNEVSNDALAEFRKINVYGTLSLARHAFDSGVKRFIFISSIKVNGECTKLGEPFNADDKPAPMDPYGLSKCEAEQGLQQLANDTGLEIVIIRPPLVYGPGVKANFLTMIRWVNSGFPLPLGAINNKRSFVSIENLVDLIVTCIDHPAASNEIFLVSDGEDLSTTQILMRLANLLGKKSRLIRVPQWLIILTATMLKKRSMAQRICSSLQIDIGKNYQLLGWTPPVTLDRALLSTVSDFLSKRY